jgi:hypothetical protein
MNKYPLNSDDGELTDAELRRLIDETVNKRMQIIYDDHLADYWARKKKFDELQQRQGREKGMESSKSAAEYAAYDPSALHGLRAIITEEVRQRVMAMLQFPLDGENREGNLNNKIA